MDGAVDLARDRELVEACQAGDETAFTELYSRYHRRLLRFCLQRLHAADDAEEAVQEAFTRAWRALPRFGGERRFYPWLTVIAANVCTDMLRRRSRLVSLDEVPARAAEPAAEADLDERLLQQVDLAMASEALGHLSDRHQRVLRLREATEWTSQRIAEHEGVAVPAVDTLLWRARQAFKREFAALSDGGLAAALGLGIAALRRAASRAGTRLGALAAFPARSPGTLVATAAIAGAAVAGGGIALLGVAPHWAAPASTAAVTTPVAPLGGAAPGAPSSGAPGGPAGSPAAGAGAGAGTAPSAGTQATGGGAGTALGTPAVTTAPAATSSLAGGASGLATSGANPVAALGTAGTTAAGGVGRVVGTGVAALGQVITGLTHATAPAGTGTTGTAGGTSADTGSGSATPVTVGGAVGAVGTAVSGVSGAVSTAVGSTTQGLLGTSL